MSPLKRGTAKRGTEVIVASRKNYLSLNNCMRLIVGDAASLIVFTPNAFAKHSSSGGTAQVTGGDGLVTYTPIMLCPPNHHLTQSDISFAAPHPEGNPDATTACTVNVACDDTDRA